MKKLMLGLALVGTLSLSARDSYICQDCCTKETLNDAECRDVSVDDQNDQDAVTQADAQQAFVDLLKEKLACYLPADFEELSQEEQAYALQDAIRQRVSDVMATELTSDEQVDLQNAFNAFGQAVQDAQQILVAQPIVQHLVELVGFPVTINFAVALTALDQAAEAQDVAEEGSTEEPSQA